jgi:hypothetical protein
MQVGHITHAGKVASAQEKAAVAELMAPSESLVGRPPLYLPRSGGCGVLALLLSPSEPDDDE